MITPPRKTRYSKWFLLIAVTGTVIGGAFLYYQRTKYQPKPLPKPSFTYTEPSQSLPSAGPTESQLPPESLLISVPFTPQAPTANWDELHEEACEEASTIMAHAYFNGIDSLPPELVEREISSLTAWQDRQFGFHLSINTQETAEMIESVYDLHTQIVPMSEATIKKALSENKLVIAPVNGQLLKNPFFTPPGPIYHMFVVTGYNEQGFITNDPGTKRGKDYQYTYDRIYSATGNWNHRTKSVDLYKKEIIIVYK